MSAIEIPTIPVHLRPWLTRAEACAVGNVGLDTLKGAIYAGDLRECRGAGSRCGRIARADLDAWISSRAST